ncbi:MAG: preprotein translocase subunit SecG [Desulfobulbaceae bacterium]|nr:preprotein translocase subunit SecG [Desulfobulbaceae bacterium]
MTTILTIVHIIVCFFLVIIVLLQQGKGASIGATFGGSSQTVFGTDGPMPLLNKVTTASAVIFMVTSISLAYLSAHKSTSSVMQDLSVQKSQESAIERAPEPLPETDLPLTPPAAEEIPMAPGQDASVETTVPAQDMALEPAAQEAAETEAPPSAVEEPPAAPENGGKTE